jgi:hypothetical protein
MTDVVLLHGAWHQPAHFDDLVERLADAGLRAAVPDLLGRAPAEGRRAVEEIVAAAPRPPLLVTHSMGGVVGGAVTGAARVLHMAAWILDVDESPMQLIRQDVERTGIPPTALPMAPDAAGDLRLDPDGARAGLYADCTDAVAERAIALLRAEPPAIFAAAPPAATWPDVPSHYLAGSADRSMSASLTAMFAARCTTSETWPTSHSAYLSRPERVVALIRQLVATP